jgi:hypothetical protein
MGIRQLKMHAGWAMTAGRAVIVYGAVEMEAATLVTPLADIDTLSVAIDVVLDVDN